MHHNAYRHLLTQCSNRMIAFDNTGTDFEKTEAVDSLLGMIDNMIYGQTYYSNDMLSSAEVAFMRRVKETEQVDAHDAVRREIEAGGIAFNNIVLALGYFGTLLIGILISCPSGEAAKAVGRAIQAAHAGGAAGIAANVGEVAVVTSKAAVHVATLMSSLNS